MTQRKKSLIKLSTSGIPVRERGQGRLYLTANCRNWISEWYDSSGRRRCKSTGTPDLKQAELRLGGFMEATRQGKMPLPAVQRITVDQLVEDVFNDYVTEDQTSLPSVRRRWKLHLARHFSGVKAAMLNYTDIEDYKEARLKEGAAKCSINRELCLLRRALTLGEQHDLVTKIPAFHLFNEADSVRTNFLEPGERYARMVAAACNRGLWFRTFLELGWVIGWRHQELLCLKSKAFDQVRGTLSLEAHQSKTRKPREVAIIGTALELVRQCCIGKGPNDYIISRNGGRRVRDLYKAWDSCCVEAGEGKWVCRDCGGDLVPQKTEAKRPGRGRPPHDWYHYCPGCDRKISRNWVGYFGLHVHDLRRSAAIRMIRACIPHKMIMDVMGWSSTKMLERYAVANVESTKVAAEKLAAYDTAMEAQRIALAQVALNSQGSAGYDGDAGSLPGTEAPATQVN